MKGDDMISTDDVESSLARADRWGLVDIWVYL